MFRVIRSSSSLSSAGLPFTCGSYGLGLARIGILIRWCVGSVLYCFLSVSSVALAAAISSCLSREPSPSKSKSLYANCTLLSKQSTWNLDRP